MKRLASLLALLVPVVAHAGNGLYDLGYGPESTGLGSADVAFARDTFALNTNPAGLAQIPRQTIDLMLEPFALSGFNHKDSLGNDDAVDSKAALAFAAGYARRVQGTGVVAGVGLFFQGGSGFSYSHFNTPFGTQDELSGISGSIKLAPGFGWRVNERWSVGASLGVLYSTARQKFFPHTSSEDPVVFHGFRADALYGISFNYKAGLQYRPAPDWTLGLVYTSKAKIRLENGTMNVDYDDRIVEYEDARQTGLAFPREVNLGLMHRFGPRWMAITELTWFEWSDSLKSTTIAGKKPNVPDAPATFSVTSPLEWRDQYLFSAGVMFQWTPTTALRAGFSHARNPVPRETLNPTLPTITRTSLAIGAIHSLGERWLFNTTFALQLPENKTYDSPLTGRSREHAEVYVLYFCFSRRT